MGWFLKINNTQIPALGSLLDRLWRHINQKRRIQLGLVFLLMIFASIAEIVSLGSIVPFLGALTSPDWVWGHSAAQPIIKIIGLTEPKDLLLPMTVLFAITAVISGVVRLILQWALARLSHAIGADFSISIFQRTLYQPYSVHVARNSSEIIAGIASKADKVVYEAVLPCMVILSSCLLLIAIMATLIALEPIIAFGAFAGFGGIYLLVATFTKKKLAIYSSTISYEQNRVVKVLQEALGGIRDVLIDGTQRIYCKVYRNADLPLRRAAAGVVIMIAAPRYAIEGIGMAFIAILAYKFASSAAGAQGAIPMLGALALGAQRLLPVLHQAYASWTSMRGGQSSLADTLNLLEQPLPDYVDEEAKKPEPISFKRDIVFSKVSFSYVQNGQLVLSNLDMVIPKGSRIGIIGGTGSGKSTLLDIFMGLLQPTSGTMLIDGQQIDVRNHRSWQCHISHVPQAIFLADTSVAENIALGVPVESIDMKRVQEAARKAQVANVIESWPEGYNTFVGERGVRLSGGQRQRIGIARALYKNADVIVFDEATSALDSATETAVMDAVESLSSELTILIVAHRLSTLKGCSEVIELGGGAIKRIGSYAEVVNDPLNDLHGLAS